MGGFLMTGGINEVWSLLLLLVVFKLYRSDELTQKEVQERLQKLKLRDKQKAENLGAGDFNGLSNEEPGRTASIAQPQNYSAKKD
jgi:hypothetical protein